MLNEDSKQLNIDTMIEKFTSEEKEVNQAQQENIVEQNMTFPGNITSSSVHESISQEEHDWALKTSETNSTHLASSGASDKLISQEQAIIEQFKLSNLPSRAKPVASWVATIVVLIVWVWIFSVQYPQEVDSAKNMLGGLAGAGQKNISQSEITGSNETTHGVAGDDSFGFPVETPLSDAMDSWFSDQAIDDDTNTMWEFLNDVISWSEVDKSWSSQDYDERDDIIIDEPVDEDIRDEFDDDNMIDKEYEETIDTGWNVVDSWNSLIEENLDDIVHQYQPDFDLPVGGKPDTPQFLNLLENLSLKVNLALGNAEDSKFETILKVLQKNIRKLQDEMIANSTVTDEKWGKYQELEKMFTMAMKL